MALYHIATIAQWQAAQESGSYIADSLGIEGFIHCSTETQIRPVANAFFRGQQGLVLLELGRDRLLSEVRDEWVDAGGIFPAEMSSRLRLKLWYHIVRFTRYEKVVCLTSLQSH